MEIFIPISLLLGALCLYYSIVNARHDKFMELTAMAFHNTDISKLDINRRYLCRRLVRGGYMTRKGNIVYVDSFIKNAEDEVELSAG